MKKPTRCQICGDVIPDVKKGKHTCPDCHERAAQPRTSAALAGHFTCVECGAAFILATGECVAHHGRHRYCVGCWQKSPSRFRVAAVKKDPVAPEWAIELGIDMPYTMDAVKKRYRELSFKHHPDHGGNGADFIRITKFYDIALAHFDQQTFEVAA